MALDLEELKLEVSQYESWIKMRVPEVLELIHRVEVAEALVLRLQDLKGE